VKLPPTVVGGIRNFSPGAVGWNLTNPPTNVGGIRLLGQSQARQTITPTRRQQGFADDGSWVNNENDPLP